TAAPTGRGSEAGKALLPRRVAPRLRRPIAACEGHERGGQAPAALTLFLATPVRVAADAGCSGAAKQLSAQKVHQLFEGGEGPVVRRLRHTLDYEALVERLGRIALHGRPAAQQERAIGSCRRHWLFHFPCGGCAVRIKRTCWG